MQSWGILKSRALLAFRARWFRSPSISGSCESWGFRCMNKLLARSWRLGFIVGTNQGEVSTWFFRLPGGSQLAPSCKLIRSLSLGQHLRTVRSPISSGETGSWHLCLLYAEPRGWPMGSACCLLCLMWSWGLSVWASDLGTSLSDVRCKSCGASFVVQNLHSSRRQWELGVHLEGAVLGVLFVVCVCLSFPYPFQCSYFLSCLMPSFGRIFLKIQAVCVVFLSTYSVWCLWASWICGLVSDVNLGKLSVFIYFFFGTYYTKFVLCFYLSIKGWGIWSWGS